MENSSPEANYKVSISRKKEITAKKKTQENLNKRVNLYFNSDGEFELSETTLPGV
jgi:hypothetical protein